MKRNFESLRGPYIQEEEKKKKKVIRSTEAIDPVLKILEEKRKAKKLIVGEEGKEEEEDKEEKRTEKVKEDVEGIKIKEDLMEENRSFYQEVKTKEDEEEVIGLCKKIFEVHNKCKVLTQENQDILNEISLKLMKLEIKWE